MSSCGSRLVHVCMKLLQDNSAHNQREALDHEGVAHAIILYIPLAGGKPMTHVRRPRCRMSEWQCRCQMGTQFIHSG